MLNENIAKPMLCSIIITYKRSGCIKKCITSLLQQEIGQKIVVIDNISKDKTVGVIKKIQTKDIAVIENKDNIGFAAAVNQAIKFALENFSNIEYFFLLNPDAYLEKNCLDKLIAESSQNKTLGLLSPLIMDSITKKPWFSGAKISWLKFKTLHTELLSPDPECLSGCAMLVKKKAIEKIGFFDEHFFLYYEDADFSLRTKKFGFGMKIIPDAVCHHHESQSSIAEIKNYHLVKSGLLFFYKHSSKYSLPWFWLNFFLRYFYHKYFSKKTTVLKAMRDFFTKLRGDKNNAIM